MYDVCLGPSPSPSYPRLLNCHCSSTFYYCFSFSSSSFMTLLPTPLLSHPLFLVRPCLPIHHPGFSFYSFPHSHSITPPSFHYLIQLIHQLIELVQPTSHLSSLSLTLLSLFLIYPAPALFFCLALSFSFSFSLSLVAATYCTLHTPNHILCHFALAANTHRHKHKHKHPTNDL